MNDPEFPEPTPEELELSRKVAELAEAEEALAAREIQLATLERQLHVFEIQYLAAVGRRYAELDTLRAEIAEIEARLAPGDVELLERAEEARAQAQQTLDALEGAQDPSAPPITMSESLKKLFRQVARVIHPDLAEDEESRAKRQELMAAANRAYETGDETRLAAILQEWEESPEAVSGQSAAADLLRAIRQIARVQERTRSREREIEALQTSDLYRLRTQVEQAEKAGRDLLAEMAAGIEPQVEEARARLEALLAGETGS